jgi:hypothetical protein
MTSPVDVANLALDAIGAGLTITSLTPPAPAPNANVVARQFGPKMQALQRAAHWNFNRAQVSLNLLKARQGTPENPGGTTLPQPPVPWLYEYQVPADCLAARFLICNPPNTSGTTPPIFPQTAGVLFPIFPQTGWKFQVATDTDASGNRLKVILTDLEFADLVYTTDFTNNPDLWDASFLMAAPAFLGMWLVNPINRNAVIYKEMVEMTAAVVTQARISDGNEGLESQDNIPDWIRVRESWAIGWGPPGIGQCFYGWSSLGLPGGTFI